uniref:Uncharacterized protein n=1 Tax=Knipowitschia caucasica TaxID=637954 RepID=A0AAV2MF05_KNICA
MAKSEEGPALERVPKPALELVLGPAGATAARCGARLPEGLQPSPDPSPKEPPDAIFTVSVHHRSSCGLLWLLLSSSLVCSCICRRTPLMYIPWWVAAA